MVKKNVLERFVRLRGYDVVKRKRDGSFRNISEASKRTGISRPTIYTILKEYPEAPSKTKPKYVEEFEDSEGYRGLREMYEKALSTTEYNNTVHDVLKAWKFFNKKDAVSWNEDDFKKVWNWEEFHHPLAQGFEEHHGTKFRRLMRAIERHDLVAKFRSKKIPPGAKKE